MNKPNTYKTNHPTIKEITIGDQFVLNDGEIVTFVRYNTISGFEMTNGWYNHDLMYNGFLNDKNFRRHIKSKFLSIRHKLDLL